MLFSIKKQRGRIAVDHKKCARIAGALCIVSLILCIIAYFTKALWLSAVCIGLVILAELLQLLFYRCPECGRSLKRMRCRAKYCPHCGAYLGW